MVTEKANEWLSPAYDEETRKEVQAMLDNEDKTPLIDAFYRELEFGTGGLRGIMGAGSNRMNIYTVGKATQGLANYLNEVFKDREQISVVVGHDCRNNSRLFAEITANIFSANGIKVYLFEDLRPTPEISFAIRYLGCQSGVNITASHNPKEYNGYKAYWDDGAQMLSPHDVKTIENVEKVRVEDIKFQGNPALIEIIGEEVDNAYLDRVKTLIIDPEVISKHKDLKIVYTPIHGCGRVLIPASLRRWVSVQDGIPNPPSLENIFKELKSDLGIEKPKNGNLTKWAKEGVLLMNTSLSVRAHQANSHSKCGWAWFTDSVIKLISEQKEHVVFILWGGNARSKKPLIDTSKHLILECAHPSPLSAYNGFFGCKHFSKTNEYLKEKGLVPIDWDLTK